MRSGGLILLTTMGSVGLLACSGKRLDDGTGGAGVVHAGSGGGALAGSGGGQGGSAMGAAGSIVPSGTGGAAASGVGGNAVGGNGTGGSGGAGGAAGGSGNGLSVNPIVATFASTVVEAVSAPQTLTVRNEGNTASAVAALQGFNAADYLITSNGCGATLQPGASCDITVAFAPKTRSGYRYALLTVGTPSGMTASASLNGVAIPALGFLAGGTAPDAARINSPIGIASDRAGNLYITDYNAIREVDIATGAVTTIAGVVDQSGAADGTGADARFKYPNGIASDGTGNLYVADTGNETIRKVVIATGAVTTLAGLAGGGATFQYGYCGYADGTGADARFCNPGGIASDGAGTLYVADSGGGTIRKIVIATGAVTTLAGSAGSYGTADGTGTDARFNTPIGIVSDGAGNLYVAETGGNTIRKVVIATGAVTTLAGAPQQPGSADGTGRYASFYGPTGIASDGAGHLYVTDTYNYTVRKVVIATGAVTTLAGTPTPGMFGTSTDGTGADARFFSPHGLASDGAGHLYVADTDNYNIRQVVIATARVTTIAGAGRPDIADGTGAAARFNNPAGITSDGADNLYVADTGDSAIRKVVVATGAVTTIAGAGWFGSADGIGADALFNHPEGVACDRAGNLYVADTGNNTIRKIALASGAVTTIAGAVGQFGSVDGTGAAARFSGPTGLTSDGAGGVYVADTANSTIRKIVIATGAVTTIAGAGSPGSADGTGTAARFSYPYGLAFDSAGNLYVADTGNSTIRKIVIGTGAVTTPFGKAGETGSAAGSGTGARFTYPYGIAGGGAGILYVADTGSNTIRIVSIEEMSVYNVIGFPGRVGVSTGALPASLNTSYGLAFLPTGELAITDFAENAVLIGHL